MIQGYGKSVCKGIAVGKIYLYRRQELSIEKSSGDYEYEKKCFLQGKQKAYEELEYILGYMKGKFAKEEVAILEVQQIMLDDFGFLKIVDEFLQMKKSASEAVFLTGERLGTSFDAMEDDYIKGRGVDVRDVTRRILRILAGTNQVFSMEEQGIVVANDLTPTDIVLLPRDKVLAIVTQNGSRNSHGVLLARTMNIPILIQADMEIEETLQGKELVVDGLEQSFYLEPTKEILSKMKEKREQFLMQEQTYLEYRDRATVTPDGNEIHLYANISAEEEIETVIDAGAEGIGLVRTEFSYMGRQSQPSEEELFESYMQIIKKMQGKLVVIRTLDVGADKNVPYIQIEKEENPALGYRGIRMSLQEKSLFYTQLRAIYRSSAFGRVGILLPMIISVDEVVQAKAMIEQVKEELHQEGVAIGHVPLGVMIETPAAVFISGDLAKEVDFFSVGTNDLTQYTLAADRQNERLESIYDHCHPAILAQLRMVLSESKKAGIPVGICGELAEDMSLTHKLIEMGFRTLSVSASQILKVRKNICEGNT